MKRLIFSLFVLGIFVVASGSGYATSFTIHQLTDNSIHDVLPSLYDGTIAWNDHNYSIHYWDGSDITNVGLGCQPSLNGIVVWQGWSNPNIHRERTSLFRSHHILSVSHLPT